MTKSIDYIQKLFAPTCKAVAISSLTGCADAFLAVALALKNQPGIVLAVVPGIPDADRLTDDLRLIVSQPGDTVRVRILELPPVIADDHRALGTRLKTIAALKAWSLAPYPAIVVVPFVSLSRGIPSGTAPAINVSIGSISFTELSRQLAENGYSRVPQVEKEGDYSVRGGLIDAWSPGDEFPVRAEFFDEDLESLRSFNPATQRSITRLSAAALLPAIEHNGDDDNRASVFSLLPANSTILALEHNAYTLTYPGKTFNCIFTGDPPPPATPTLPLPTSALPGFAELAAGEAHHPELFDAARQRLERHLDAAAKRGSHILRLDELSAGFELGDLIVVTKADRVFTKHRKATRSVNASLGQRINDFDDLEPGEYVVHVDYGVGRYTGSSFIKMDGEYSEVFNVEYADGAKLHVPAAHAHLLSRYVGVKGEAVRLHRLDG